MKKIKQPSHGHKRNSQLSYSYRYSPLYYNPHQSTSDSKSQTSILSPKQNKNSNKNLQIRPISDNQHIVDLYDNISNNGDITIVDDSDLQLLALYVRETKQRASLQKDFDQVDNLDDKLSLIKDEITSRSKNLQDQLNSQRTNYEVEDVKNMNEEMLNIQEQELQEFDNNTNQIINETMENQECEQNSFDNNWETSMPNKYRKPSTALLQMKQIEKSAILVGDISKARQMQVEIEEQTQKEASEQIKKFNSDYTKMKKRLIDKQQQEMERIKQNRRELRQIIVTKHELDKEVYSKRINVINNKDTTSKQIKSSQSESGTELYGCSLSHIMQETQFGIDPLLPELPQQNCKTGPIMHSNFYNSPNKNNISRTRPNSRASTKRGSSVQVGSHNLCKFKWILAPSPDPKYRTKTDDSSPKPKKKENFKFVKKPNFTNKFDYIFSPTKNQTEKSSINHQTPNLNNNEQQRDKISKEFQSNDSNSPNEKKYSVLDTNEIKFSFDADSQDEKK